MCGNFFMVIAGSDHVIDIQTIVLNLLSDKQLEVWFHYFYSFVLGIFFEYEEKILVRLNVIYFERCPRRINYTFLFVVRYAKLQVRLSAA